MAHIATANTKKYTIRTGVRAGQKQEDPGYVWLRDHSLRRAHVTASKQVLPLIMATE